MDQPTADRALCVALERPTMVHVLQLHREGYRHQPVAPVSMMNDVLSMRCPWCEARQSLELWPMWKHGKCRGLVFCHGCRRWEEV